MRPWRRYGSRFHRRRVRGRRADGDASVHLSATRMYRSRMSTLRAMRDRMWSSLEPVGSGRSWGCRAWGRCRSWGSSAESPSVPAEDEASVPRWRHPPPRQVPGRLTAIRPGSWSLPRRRCLSRSCCVRGLHGSDAAGGRRFRSRFPRRPMTEPRLRRGRRRKIRWFVARRPSDVGRRWWSRRRLPRPGCPGSYGELPSLDARGRDVGERGDRTGGVVPACGTIVSVERTRPQPACAAAIRAARVIAHPIRPSPALAFPRSRLSGDPGPGGRRFARLLNDQFDLARAPHGELRSASRSGPSIAAGSAGTGRRPLLGAGIGRLLRTLSAIWGRP